MKMSEERPSVQYRPPECVTSITHTSGNRFQEHIIFDLGNTEFVVGSSATTYIFLKFLIMQHHTAA